MSIEICSVHRNILVEEVLVQANLALGAHAELLQLVANHETRVLGAHTVAFSSCCDNLEVYATGHQICRFKRPSGNVKDYP